MSRILKALFTNPWAMCALAIALSLFAGFMALDTHTPDYWTRMAVAGLFGLGIGFVNWAEIRSPWSVLTKRLFGAALGLTFAGVTTYLLHIDPLFFWPASIVLGATARDWMKHLTLAEFVVCGAFRHLRNGTHRSFPAATSFACYDAANWR
jgi:hypothetical protein